MDYEKFFKENYGQVRSFVYKLVLDWHDAEDITQDAFLSFFKVDKTGKVMNGSINYLYQCAKRKVIDFGRKRVNYYRFHNQYTDYLSSGSGISEPVNLEAELMDKLTADRLYAAIAELNAPRCKDIMQRVYVYGQDYDQISKELNLAPRTLYNQKNIGIEKIRAKFGITEK